MEARRSQPLLVPYETIDSLAGRKRQSQNSDFTRIPIYLEQVRLPSVRIGFYEQSQCVALDGAALRRRLGQRVNDAVDDLLDQHLVVALAHHADDRLGAGRTNEQTAMAVEASL